MTIEPPKEWTVLSMLDWATAFFSEKKIPSPRLSIEWLLAHSLGLKRLDLYLQYDRPLKPIELETLRSLVLRRAKNEPLQYIVGETDFYNGVFSVNKHVLIPRPETEELVELVLNNHKNLPNADVLDIGTGSGCIAICLKMERPDWEISGIDISPEALEVAKLNAKKNNVTVSFSLGNLFADHVANSTKFDLIISNPPYIMLSEAEEMDIQVKKYEPSLALFAENPVRVYESIISIATRQLKPQNSSALYLEINENLSEPILNLFNRSKWNSQLILDLSGKPRMIQSYLR